MQHPSGHLIWQYVSSGPILWGCSSLLPKQDAFSLLLCSRMILSPWNSWTWDFLLVLRRPIETAAVPGQVANQESATFGTLKVFLFLPFYWETTPSSLTIKVFQAGVTVFDRCNHQRKPPNTLRKCC